MQDSELQKPIEKREWKTILKPTDTLVISEFECFDSFIAVYATELGRPQVIIKDLNDMSKPNHVVRVNEGDIGEIEPMLNQEYNQTHLRFLFSSPFVY